MRLAILSDIHGNAVALDATLADLERHPADGLVCLGDAVQGGAQPEAVVARLRALGCPVVMGNADAWLLSGVGEETQAPARRAILEDVRAWSLARLSEADRAFIAAFAPTVALRVGGRSFLGYHGSPGSFDDILLPETPEPEARRMLEPYATDFMAGGHVHLQFVRRLGPATHFNPGSVGVAYDREGLPERWRVHPWAEYAVLEAGDGRVGLEFRRVSYDAAAYGEAARRNGRPHVAELLRQHGLPA